MKKILFFAGIIFAGYWIYQYWLYVKSGASTAGSDFWSWYNA